jgi:hypothetical protein
MDVPSGDPVLAELKAIRQEISLLRQEAAEHDAARQHISEQSVANQQQSMATQQQAVKTQKQAMLFIRLFLLVVAIGILLFLARSLAPLM